MSNNIKKGQTFRFLGIYVYQYGQHWFPPILGVPCKLEVPTPCLASPQPQVSCPRAGPPPPSLIHMVELGFVGLLNNPKRIFAQLQKLEVKLART